MCLSTPGDIKDFLLGLNHFLIALRLSVSAVAKQLAAAAQLCEETPPVEGDKTMGGDTFMGALCWYSPRGVRGGGRQLTAMNCHTEQTR